MTLLSPRFSSSQSEAIDHLAKIAIIGRGFTGIMTAIALFKGIECPFHLVMFDPRPKIDIGEAVNQSSAAVLTSRVRDLSIDPAVRNDFRQWLEKDDAWRHRLGSDFIDIEDSFVPGETFRTYVYGRFSEALTKRPDVVVQFLSESVTAIDRHPQAGLSIAFGAGQRKRFDAVFLASGYGLRDSSDEAATPNAARTAVVIGGGVQAVDKALILLSEGKVSHVSLISESGFLPQSHANAAVGAVFTDQPIPRTLRGAFRFLRQAAMRADAQGLGWQGIMNGFRSHARDLWEGLTPQERGRFKRHVQAVYESHRNRLPPEHYRRLHHAIETGAITVRKEKVDRIATNGVLLSTPAGFEVLGSDMTIDCRFRPSAADNPLVRSIVSAGLAKSDELGIGIVVDECGQTSNARSSCRGLFAMGPLGLGSIPDIDLVPQIVLQSHAAAASLNGWLGEAAREAVGKTSTVPG
ncbi:FAD/NAD(P)-binding protein [Rhizobium sp. A37_96]